MGEPATHSRSRTARAREVLSFGGRLLRAIQSAFRLLKMMVAGRAGPMRNAPEPSKLAVQAIVLGIPNARFFSDSQADAMVEEALRAIERERALRPDLAAPGSSLPPANYLGISGGSDNGAFGAGLLVGWTEAGTRPEFKLVTGVSTGALIAPFAFLGPEYDPQLRAVYTDVNPGDIFEKRSILNAMTTMRSRIPLPSLA